VKHFFGAAVIVISLAGCVSSGTYRAQVARASSAQMETASAQSQLDEAKSTLEKQKVELATIRAERDELKSGRDELQTKLKASEDQLAATVKSNQELTATLEAKTAGKGKKKDKHASR
jgi:septal ring factor EnvC (AmiA/AmiB activator)